MTLRTLTCAVAALAAVVSFVAPASADTVTFTDPRGDAVARYDLTRTTASHDRDRLLVVQRVRNLRGGHPQVYGFNASTRAGGTNVHVVRRKNGTVTTRVMGPATEEVACDVRVRWRLDRDVIRVPVPRDCIAGRGRLRVSTFIGYGDGTFGDPADWTKTVRVDQS